jgi:hypothetical protein
VNIGFIEPKLEGERLVIAGANLLLWSHLVTWDPAVEKFKPNTIEEYECWWKANLIQKYGRLITWTAFSVGAEYLAKGVCLLRYLRSDLIDSTKKGVLQLPSSEIDIDKWIIEEHKNRETRNIGVCHTKVQIKRRTPETAATRHQPVGV